MYGKSVGRQLGELFKAGIVRREEIEWVLGISLIVEGGGLRVVGVEARNRL
jgi:hypothetical protein